MTKTRSVLSRVAALVLCAVMFVCAAVPVFAADCTAGLTPGDANGDGKVTLQDAIVIIRYAAKWPVNINLDNADVLNDGTINVRDAILIIKVAAKWTDVRLGHNDVTNVVNAATCTAGGSSILSCTICGSTKQIETKALGHDYKDGVCVRCSSISPAYEDYYKLVDWIKTKGSANGDGNYTFVVDQTLDLYGFGEATMFYLKVLPDESTVLTLSYLYQPDNQSFYNGTLAIHPDERTTHTFNVDYYYVDGADIKYQHTEGKIDNSKNAIFTKGYWGYSDSEMSYTTNNGALTFAQLKALEDMTEKYLRTMFLEAEFDLIGSNVSLADFGFIMN